jgi:parallel beta-helix repeat protein
MRNACIFLLTLVSCWFSPFLAATEYYVANSGNDANAGSLASPFATVQKAVSRVVAGDRISIRGGTYREAIVFSGKNGTAAAPIVVAAYPGEKPVLKGSKLVSGWTLHGGATYKHAGWTWNSQQVFDDGVALQQIGVASSVIASISYNGQPFLPPVGSGVSSMTPGSFHYDAAAQVLYVRLADGGIPANSVIEASFARRIVAMDANTSFVVLRNLSFRHSSSSAYDANGAAIELANSCSLENCDVQWCDFAGVAFGYRLAGSRVVDCTISNNGDVGIQGSSHRNFLIRNCTVANNNYRKFSTLWHAGGMKLTTQAYGTVENCTVRDNRGVGIWFDWADSGNPIVVRNNRVMNNYDRGAGIMMEGSKAGTIYNNVLVGNDRRGIYISASDDMKIYNNTIVGTKGFAAVDIAGMPRPGKTLTNIRLFNNIICDTQASDDIRIIKENGGDVRNLSCDYNCVWRSVGALSMWWGLDGRGGWQGTRYSSMAAWVAATPFSDHCIQADPKLSTAHALTSGSPARDVATTLAEVANDLVNVRRPQYQRYDMGAYEFPQVVQDPSLLQVKVNFQPASSPAPAGFLVDDGSVYGAKNDATYGWALANPNSRDRNAAISPDQRYDTFNYLKIGAAENFWQIAVPSGKYRVRVVCGDPSYTTGYFKVKVEGALTVDGRPTAQNHWVEGISEVSVSDGQLTISNAAGADYTKICFVAITAM